jgi:hypothetical protein
MDSNEDVVCVSRSLVIEMMKAHDRLSGRVIRLMKENKELRRQRNDMIKLVAEVVE